MATLLSILVTLLVFGLVAGLFYYVIQTLVPPPFKRVLLVVLTVIVVIVAIALIYFLIGVLPHGMVRM